ncbi:non-specific phospholipase C3-like [Telopea speciosissima]|uniref:non-specific phospholipase C3-like n=1 Tax=Telopea speciosissima TaxID=54955 RepID=UPI001CC6CCED|nr:non-specific phospholipase C3-like [Telopea speciosissima]
MRASRVHCSVVLRARYMEEASSNGASSMQASLHYSTSSLSLSLSLLRSLHSLLLSFLLFKNQPPPSPANPPKKPANLPTMAPEPNYPYPIKTVVVLIQENRSFDHMLGWMKSLNPEIDGVTGNESNPLSTSDPNSNRIYFRDQSQYVDPDPDHSYQGIYEQVFGVAWSEENSGQNLEPTMQGFAMQAEQTLTGMSETVMNGFTPDSVPVFKELVSEFAVCDRWFASNPASTQPNRLFVHSGTSHGLTSNDTHILIEGLPQKTIFDSLDEAGFSFGIYYQYPPATLFYRNLRKLKYIGKFHQFDLTFKNACKEGKLPNYVVVEQRYFDSKILPGNDDHPSHDVSEGQKFIKEVYEALRSSPQWNEILFIITYDEHGGFYDHVPTPVTGVPSPDGIVGPAPYYFKFDRLGVRLPAIFISPWIEPGTVMHEPSGPYPTSQFEHSSIPAAVKKIFNLKDFLTKRDEWAGTFETLLTRTTPRTDCPVTLPEPVRMREAEANEDAKLNDFQQILVQMAASLNGDHRNKEIFPDQLVENMTVGEAIKYCEDAFKKFLEASERARSLGADESEIVECSTYISLQQPSRTFVNNLFSCFNCFN